MALEHELKIKTSKNIVQRHVLLLPMVPQNWVHLFVGVEPKDATKPKNGRRKDLLLAASKENTRDLSQSSVSLKTGEVLS